MLAKNVLLVQQSNTGNIYANNIIIDYLASFSTRTCEELEEFENDLRQVRLRLFPV